MPDSAVNPEAFRDDLLFLRDMFPQLDRSFTVATRSEFRRRVDSLLTRPGELTSAAFGMGVARALAATDNAHSMPVLFHWLRVAPARFHWFSDGLYVIRSAAGPPSLVGGRVIAIDGRPVDYWQSRLASVIAGNRARRRALSAFYLTSPDALAALERAPERSALALTFEAADGGQSDCVLHCVPLTDNAAIYPERDPAIGVAAEEPIAWRQVFRDDSSLPLYLREFGRNIVHEWLPERRTLHLVLRRLANSDDINLETHLLDIAEEAARLGIRNAVVDLRFNTGGNYVLAQRFCRSLPDLLPQDGRLFVISNNQTFSAGIAVAALLKFHGGARSIIAGEPMGDRPSFWAEGGVFDLPRTGLPVCCAVSKHDWEHGCRDPSVCAWFNLLYSVPAGSLRPTVAVPTRYADYATGIDPVLRVVLDQLR